MQNNQRLTAEAAQCTWIQSPPLKSLADALVIKIGTQAYNTTPRTSGDVGSGTMQRKELWSY